VLTTGHSIRVRRKIKENRASFPPTNAAHHPVREARTTPENSETRHVQPETSRNFEFFRFFRNLLGWETRSRVWPGQTAPQRSIFAPCYAHCAQRDGRDARSGGKSKTVSR